MFKVNNKHQNDVIDVNVSNVGFEHLYAGWELSN